MREAHTVEQVRRAEQAHPDFASGALMQRAAAGLAAAIVDLMDGRVVGRRVALLVGSGDNGGDALFAGARLARRGAAVEAVLLAERVHEAGLAALRAAGGRVARWSDQIAHVAQPTGTSRATISHTSADVVVDGIVGIGGRPGLRPEAVAACRAWGVPLGGDPGPSGAPDGASEAGRSGGRPLVVAVDVPSGVEVDTGRVEGLHVRADLTVTFGTLKACHLVDPAAEACGTVELLDLGLDLPPAELGSLGPADVARLLPVPGAFAHKYVRGVVGVRAGSATYPGAAILGAAGAASGLAGMVRYRPVDGDPATTRAVLAALPEVVPTTGEERVQAWVVGSGGGEAAGAALAEALADGVPVVVDADALAAVTPGAGSGLVLTPHAGELARMLGTTREAVEADQLGHARQAAGRFDAVVLLKNRHSLVADPAGRVLVTTTGTPWLATAGAGDVLAGLVGALLAGGLAPFDAAAVGSWLHGAAATLAARDGAEVPGPIVAGDVARAVPDAVRRLLAGRP